MDGIIIQTTSHHQSIHDPSLYSLYVCKNVFHIFSYMQAIYKDTVMPFLTFYIPKMLTIV